MKLFKDKDLTQQTDTLDFGIVLAGDTKTIEYYLQNETEAEVVEIKPIVENTEVKIVSFPENLKSKEVIKVAFSWSPTITLKRGLKSALNLNFFELYE
jgi:hypothetical protein